MSWLLETASATWMGELAWRSVLLVLASMAVVALLRRASAAMRDWVWRLCFACLLALPMWNAALPAWRIACLPQTPVVSQSVGTETTWIEPSDDAEVAHRLPITPAPSSVIVGEIQDTPGAPPSEPTTTNAGAPSRRARFPWLWAVWFGGCLVTLTPLTIGLWQASRLRRRATAARGTAWSVLLDEARSELDVRTTVQLLFCSKTTAPMTFGAWNPVILLPRDADAWPEQRQRLALLHELAHIRRRDWLVQMIGQVVCALYWFNPLVWRAASRMRVEREQACDDVVLRAGCKPKFYAEELLTMAARTAPAPWNAASLAIVTMARGGALEERIRSILDAKRRRIGVTWWMRLAGVAAAISVSIPVSIVQATQSAGEPALRVSQAAQDPPAEDAPAPKLDPNQCIRISVLNEKGDQGLPSFRVIAGINARAVSQPFEKRTGRTVINWQPHTCRVGKDGDYFWPLERAYKEMALRVEADGYQPQLVTGVKRADGAKHLIFKMVKDPGVTGSVLTPAGEPAVGASIALAIPRQSIVCENGKFRHADAPPPATPRDRWNRPRFSQADAEGNFELPTEFEPAVVVVVHESGVRELAYDEWKKNPQVKLQPWASIQGQVVWGDKPGANQLITLSADRNQYAYPGMVASPGETRTAADGSFTFERVLPGRVQISQPIQIDQGLFVMAGMHRHVEAKPGEPTRVLHGGRGRKVSGKFVGLESYAGAVYHFHPQAPHIGFPGDDKAWSAFAKLKASPIGPMLFRDKQPIQADGSFTIERMLPGQYQLFLTAPGIDNYAASTSFVVAAEQPGEPPQDMVLRAIAVRKPPKRTTPRGKSAENRTIRVRGKVVDDATGEPVTPVKIQAGKFEPDDPTKVQWGYSLSSSSRRDGGFTTTIRWDQGWTARIIAEGYVSQPILNKAPPAGKNELQVEIRLKRGRVVQGVVLDHTGAAMANAGIFPIGPTGVNLAAGGAIARQENASDKPVHQTDANGRFRVPLGDATSICVSHAAFDVWPVNVPAEGELTIRLPKPARIDIELDIEGAAKNSKVFIQMLNERRKGFEGVRLEREIAIANPGRLTLPGLPPGRYQLCRQVMNQMDGMGRGAMLDREFFELKTGQRQSVRWARKTGAHVVGRVTLNPKQELMGTIVSVREIQERKDPFADRSWPIVLASLTAKKDGTFRSERIPPGKYRLVAEAYRKLTPEEQFRTGWVSPAFRVGLEIDVPESGVLELGDLALAPVSKDDPLP